MDGKVEDVGDLSLALLVDETLMRIWEKTADSMPAIGLSVVGSTPPNTCDTKRGSGQRRLLPRVLLLLPTQLLPQQPPQLQRLHL